MSPPRQPSLAQVQEEADAEGASATELDHTDQRTDAISEQVKENLDTTAALIAAASNGGDLQGSRFILPQSHLNMSSTSSAYHNLAQAYVDDLLEAHSRRFGGAGIFDNDPSAALA